MIAHIVAYTFVKGADPATIDEFHRDLARMRDELGELIVEYHHGPDLGLRAENADYGIVSVVVDETALRAYLDSTAHQTLSARFAERLFADRRAVQIEFTAAEATPAAGGGAIGTF